MLNLNHLNKDNLAVVVPSHHHHPLLGRFSSWIASFWENQSNEDNNNNILKHNASLQEAENGEREAVRIGIVGGGIAGVSVADALVRRLEQQQNQHHCPYKIVIWEADPKALPGDNNQQRTPFSFQPQWRAATARNANSMVPAAAMHVFSRKSVLWQVATDSLRELYMEWQWKWKLFWEDNKKEAQHHTKEMKLTDSFSSSSSSSFAQPPPYFAAHLFHCLGSNATHRERMSFVNFVSQYLYYTLWLGDDKADERGRVLVQLAQANRAMFLQQCQEQQQQQQQQQNRGLGPLVLGESRGFLSVHRSLEKAQEAVQEALDHGERAHLLSWEQAIEQEPHLANIPIRPLFVVHRPNDTTANCQHYVRYMIERLLQTQQEDRVQYRIGNIVKKVVMTPSSAAKSPSRQRRFEIQLEDGSTDGPFDHLVLAAGTETPLFAADLNAERACPTYPLRGYSLTLEQKFTQQQAQGGADDTSRSRNLLQQPFSFDSMYCTSVTPDMARFAGFGEFVGYYRRRGNKKNKNNANEKNDSESVASVAPTVMARYAKTVFPGATLAHAAPCYRPISPDDLPLVGEVPKVPGLYLHTGHGTLGWTMGLATGDCLAQIVHENIVLSKNKQRDAGNDDVDNKRADEFNLADGSKLSRSVLSPDRFG